jgi:hypothetical protein
MPDVDIDLADRTQILSHVQHIPASLENNRVHNTGVYFQNIPLNPLTGTASINYKTAEERGYFKIDLLNINIYRDVRDEEHLIQLMNTVPLWELLYEPEICEQLMHINGHYDTLLKMPEPVDSILRMAMFLSVIRPAKRHLIGRTWDDVAKTVWEIEPGGGYGYKKAHAISYAHLVVVHLNLICEQACPS